MKGFITGKTLKGKKELKIVPYETDHIEYRKGTWVGINSIYPTGQCKRIIKDYIEIPCGQCIACRINKTRQWVARCLAEKEEHEECCFITLTYNDESMPTVQKPLDEETGTLGNIATLEKRDYQLFMKRLRKEIAPLKIKYLISGEYGTKNMRPHYHLIIFGWKPKDLIPTSSNFQGDKYYNSDMLQRLWGKGFVVVGEVNDQTISYVARYTIKKIGDGRNIEYEKMNMLPPFIESSNGLGKNYYEINKHTLINAQNIIMSGKEGGIQLPIPKYYKTKLEEEFPEEYERKKMINKENGLNDKKLLMQMHKGLSYEQILKIEDEGLKKKLKILKKGEL